MAALPQVHLKAGREKKIRARYPWVQREEVVRADSILPGSLANLNDSEGNFLAVGTFNANSRFPFRVLSLDDETIDSEFFARRFRLAQARRQILGTNAWRECFAEADGIGGLIVDRYDQHLVVQVRHAGMEALRAVWLPALLEVYEPDSVYERSDMEGRRDEGLSPFAGPMVGPTPSRIPIEESGVHYEVPVVEGLKTGFYLDQRDSRRRLAERIQPGEHVLDAFCYLGGFSMAAARRGAETLGLDLNPIALEGARETARRNEVPSASFEEANVFEWLEAESKTRFDWIILDPPAIAKKSEKRDALKWGVWKLCYHAIPNLRPGGRLVVCSCTYQLGLPELLETIKLAAADRGVVAFLEEVTLQAPDHPYLLAFPESLYLKCAWVRIEPAGRASISIAG